MNWLQTILGVVIAAIGAGFSFAASRSASRTTAAATVAVAHGAQVTEEAKLDLARRQAAYEADAKARTAFEDTFKRAVDEANSQLDRVYKQLERVQAQNDRTLEELAREREVSAKLRDQFYESQAEVARLRTAVQVLEQKHVSILAELARFTAGKPPSPTA